MSLSFRCLLGLGFSVLLIGCGGAKEKSYRLSAAAAATGGSTSGLSAVVGPVSLPSYLDRPEIVFATGSNEFQVPADALWLGSLRENINRTLAADLGGILHSANIRSSLDPGAKGAYRVSLNIKQFHGISGREAILDLTWRIESGTGSEIISRHSGNFREPIVGDGYQSLVQAESRLLARAAQAIAASLRGR